MEKQNMMGMLELILRPAFCVQDGSIVSANRQAQDRGIVIGASISGLLITGAEEYAALKDGCLYLTMQVENSRFGASVTQVGGLDVFILEPEEAQSELQALALAARELREPLSNMMIAADRLLPTLDDSDSAAQKQAANLNRSLHHMLRLLDNMSDSARYAEERVSRQEYRNIGALMGEYFENAAALVENAGITLHFTGCPDEIRSMVDAEKLRRAVFNLISNAVKFTPKGGRIDARLTRKGTRLYLTVQDSGCGIPESQRGNVYSRFLRQPGLEDSRQGIGLGMVLIRSAATAHGGTVLIEQPQDQGLRITLTLEIRQSQSNLVRTPGLRVDYAGEWDHSLIELSESLPASLYRAPEQN